MRMQANVLCIKNVVTQVTPGDSSLYHLAWHVLRKKISSEHRRDGSISPLVWGQ